MRVRFLLFVLGTIALLSAIFTANANNQRYETNMPAEWLKQPEVQLWGVSFRKSDRGYRVRSVTKLNGSLPLREDATTSIASGKFENWSWEVRAVPSLLPSWRAWQNDEKIKRRALGPDDWSHPAATWDQAFARAHKIATYLLGHEPLPLKLTVLLIPANTAYDRSFTEENATAVPLTFAFYFPSAAVDDSEATASRFSALVSAVAISTHEYQHILADSGLLSTIGRNKTDRLINDQVRSDCWEHATTLALTSGTHTVFKWDPTRFSLPSTENGKNRKAGGKLTPRDGKPNMKRRYSDATFWADHFEAQSISAYLQDRGISDLTVRSNDPAAMNAVLSHCRAITQHSFDLTSGPYPPSQITYVPFFPDQTEQAGPALRGNGKFAE